MKREDVQSTHSMRPFGSFFPGRVSHFPTVQWGATQVFRLIYKDVRMNVVRKHLRFIPQRFV